MTYLICIQISKLKSLDVSTLKGSVELLYKQSIKNADFKSQIMFYGFTIQLVLANAKCFWKYASNVCFSIDHDIFEWRKILKSPLEFCHKYDIKAVKRNESAFVWLNLRTTYIILKMPQIFQLTFEHCVAKVYFIFNFKSFIQIPIHWF